MRYGFGNLQWIDGHEATSMSEIIYERGNKKTGQSSGNENPGNATKGVNRFFLKPEKE